MKRNVNNIKLSISLLSSGREDTIERCLLSLEVFKKEFNCEIVVVDTDPEHNPVVEGILRKYADKIIYFKWCDDFAKARNTGLYECFGEWFMFIDDDEWITDSTAIIDFLKSAESQKYGYVNYQLRNYKDRSFSRYDDVPLVRLVRRNKNLCFVGRVHEFLQPLTGKVKVLGVVGGHSGYIFEDDKAKWEHSKRNILLLEKAISEDPLEMRWRIQLLEEYDFLEDYDRQRQVCDEAIEVIKKGGVEDAGYMCGILSAARLRIERRLENWSMEKEIYNTFYLQDEYSVVASSYIHLDMALCELNLGNYNPSLFHVREYLDAYERWHNKKEELIDELLFFLEETFNDNLHDLALAIVETINRRLQVTDRKKLSISLLSAGRKDTIERCLTSLMPLKSNLRAEIVVVDTDPNEDKEVREILERYADKIVGFTWCNDFAAARNRGLEECSGQWFMYIDDDEWLIDSEPLIEFFNTNECEKYTSVDFLIRNYLDEGLTKYNDSWISRLIRLENGYHFIGRVHEHIPYVRGKAKAVPALIGHDGYVFSSYEMKVKHSERNIGLLLECIEEEPDNPHWFYQLYLEYDSIENREAQEKLCKKAIALLKNKNDAASDVYYGFFVCGLIRIVRLSEDWQKVLEISQKYYDKKRFSEVATAYLLMDIELASYKVGEPKAREYAIDYLALYEKWHDRTADLRYESLFFLEGTFTQPIFGVVVSILNSIDAKNGDWRSFEKYFPILEWDDDLPFDMTGAAFEYISLLLESEYDEHFVDIVGAFDSSQKIKQYIQQEMQHADERGRTNIIKAVEALEKKKEQKTDLTISLLSSGRIDTIERCLSSLMIFKENLNTEILIVDTDPDHREDVREILDKYADRIIRFEWCDDFAAARNAGLLESKGEWYMFVDDDEWFIEAQPIIDFLKSKEKDKYYWTDFRTRNYTSRDFSTYTDAWATRLVRRTPKLRFVGRVHECFKPLVGKCKVLEAMEGHTGYIYENDEEKKAHEQRNISLLKKLIEEEPNEPRWWLQLLQEYEETESFETRSKFCRECLHKLRNREGEGENRSRSIFAASLIRIERQKKDWKSATEVYESLAKEKRYNDVGKAYMEIDAAQAYFYAGDPAEAEKHCRCYLKYYNKLHNKLDIIHEDLMFILEETFEPHMWGLAVNLLMYLEINDGRFDAFDKYFDKAEWSDEMLYDFRGYEGKLLEIIETNPYNERFAHILEKFWSGSVARGVVQGRIGEHKTELGERYWNLVGALMKADLPEPVPYDLRILWADHINEATDYNRWYRVLFETIDPFLLDVSVWKIANKRGVRLSTMIEAVPFGKWRRYVDYFVENVPINEQKAIYEEYSLLEKCDTYHDRFYVFRAKQVAIASDAEKWENAVVSGDNGVIQLSSSIETETYQQAVKEWKIFSENAIYYYSKLYSEDAIRGDSQLMDDECRIALRVETMLEQISDDDYKAALTTIKEALGVCPELDDALTAFSHLYSSVITKKVSSPQSEMQQLIDSLYAKVDELVAQGFVNEARDIIAQIEAIAPPEMKR